MPLRSQASLKAHGLRRCPDCGALTDRVTHCFEKGHPMFPQTDRETRTEPCKVVALDDLLTLLRSVPEGAPIAFEYVAQFIEEAVEDA